MIIQGLSKYDITQEGDTIRARHLRLGNERELTTVKGRNVRILMMTDDSGRTCMVSEGVLRFLMRHDDIDYRTLKLGERSLCFDKEGNVCNRGQVSRSRKWTVFNGFGDVLTTVLVIKACAEGDDSEALRYVKEFAMTARYVVKKLTGWPFDLLVTVEEDAKEIFLQKLRKCNFQRIAPLFVMYCQSLKRAVLSRMNVPFEEVRGIDISEPCMEII